jgi:adenylate cyclase
MKRRLAAIFSTDVQGYSCLMGEDEAATVRTITVYRALIASLIQQHRGRVVDSPGYNLLAELPSVRKAVPCAVAVHLELKIRNAELLLQRRMEFRIERNKWRALGRDFPERQPFLNRKERLCVRLL